MHFLWDIWDFIVENLIAIIALLVSVISLCFSKAKYNKELYMKRKQDVFIEFYAALKAYQDKLGDFIEYGGLFAGDFDKDRRERCSDSIDDFLKKSIKLEDAYKKITPYLLRISEIDKVQLDNFIFVPTLDAHFIDLKNICLSRKETSYEYGEDDYHWRKTKIDNTGNSFLSYIRNSNALEYLEKEIIL